MNIRANDAQNLVVQQGAPMLDVLVKNNIKMSVLLLYDIMAVN